MDNNLPDDCQGRGKHLPWNQVDEEIYACWDCETQVVDEDDLQEVKTLRSGYQFVCEDCVENYIK